MSIFHKKTVAETRNFLGILKNSEKRSSMLLSLAILIGSILGFADSALVHEGSGFDPNVIYGFNQATFHQYDYNPNGQYSLAYIYSTEKIEDRILWAQDNWTIDDKLTEEGKVNLANFIRWLMKYDPDAYVQRTFLGQFPRPNGTEWPQDEIQHYPSKEILTFLERVSLTGIRTHNLKSDTLPTELS